MSPAPKKRHKCRTTNVKNFCSVTYKKMSRLDGHPDRITRIAGTFLYLADASRLSPFPKGEGEYGACNQGRNPPSLLNLPRLPSLDEQNCWRVFVTNLVCHAIHNGGDVSERNTKTVIIVDVVVPITHGGAQKMRGIIEGTTRFG